MESKNKDIDISYEQDGNVTRMMGKLLRSGVIISAFLVFIGAIFYLIHYGRQTPDYSTFKGMQDDFTTVEGIIKSFIALRSRGIIMFGLLVLVLTPIARVVFSLIVFTLQKDYTYSLISIIVLMIIILGFFGII